MPNQLRVGNITTPEGASIIFGSESTNDNQDILLTNEDTYNRYNIVVVEEDTDETLPAQQITFLPDVGSSLTSNNVQTAINELEQIVASSVPVFTEEAWILEEGQSFQVLTKTFSASAMMVYYNGLLINKNIHYSFSNNTITFLDFTAQEEDILTVIGLAAANNN